MELAVQQQQQKNISEHTCVWLRIQHNQSKGCEKHEENDVDKQVE